MDNHPLARRPHKSPAHTVKDLRGRPQRLSLLSPRRTEVPEGADYYTANFDSVNTVSRSFSLPPRPVQRLVSRPSRLQGRASYSTFEVRQPPFENHFRTASRQRVSPRRGAHCAHAQRDLEEVSQNNFRLV